MNWEEAKKPLNTEGQTTDISRPEISGRLFKGSADISTPTMKARTEKWISGRAQRSKLQRPFRLPFLVFSFSLFRAD